MDFQNRNNTANKFVCPSDRQLALRAKLRAGWSSSKTSEPLRPEEQEAIISVIRRNEEIEIAERQRVGRLVERVEKIKQHAVERGPNCCRLCGDTFGLLRPHRIICEDCRQSVCTKCSVDINIRYHTSERTREIWLCRICSETREMWKKSGAWFFKGLPRYDTPRSASANATPAPTPTPGGMASMAGDTRSVHSCHGTPTRTARVKKLTIRVNDSSSSSGPSEPEDELDGGGGSGRVEGAKGSAMGRLQREDSFRLRAYGSIRSFIDGGERKLSNSFFFGRQQSHRLSECTDYDSVSLSNGSAVAQIRRESSSLRRGSVSSSWSISESSGSGNSGTHSQSQSQSQSQYAQSQQQHCRDPLLGWLEIAISYRESFHSLDCTMVRARDLPAMDASGLTDPYCKLNIITPEALTKYTRWQRTRTVHKTRNPEFNETLQFVGVEPEELGNSLLYVALFDDDKYGHDFLGAAKVCLSTVHSTSQYRISVPLGVEDKYSNAAEIAQEWPNGKILISLCYNTKRRALVVNVKQCINLMAMDNNGSSDPFVKLQLKPDAHKNKKHKTSVKWRTLNPIYNEEFYFEASPHDLNKEMLIVTVWDKDLGKSNDFLGSVQLGAQSKGERLQQWHDCIRLPDHFHEKWHCLAPDNPAH
ncbi:rabphilin-3A isoform X2 [Drosophila subobscura]|uniref:rabphilin-3A isoform X1 n=1 Tax=Drosophila subobscura TaxID=7241 RepID=UPI00155A0E70|nr:rabphilin-3A isoform X1 [Drosophila subobscura]XP_034663232.1 rabphilin-3A isoform X2 [Drosophila subobscura]